MGWNKEENIIKIKDVYDKTFKEICNKTCNMFGEREQKCYATNIMKKHVKALKWNVSVSPEWGGGGCTVNIDWAEAGGPVDSQPPCIPPTPLCLCSSLNLMHITAILLVHINIVMLIRRSFLPFVFLLHIFHVTTRQSSSNTQEFVFSF